MVLLHPPVNKRGDLIMENKDLCTVNMDGNEYQSEDFVAVLAKDNGDASLFYQTDALTLGMAMKMVAKAFIVEMNELPDEQRSEIEDILGDAFIKERLNNNE
jgi:hypothetical protein